MAGNFSSGKKLAERQMYSDEREGELDKELVWPKLRNIYVEMS